MHTDFSVEIGERARLGRCQRRLGKPCVTRVLPGSSRSAARKRQLANETRCTQSDLCTTPGACVDVIDEKTFVDRIRVFINHNPGHQRIENIRCFQELPIRAIPIPAPAAAPAIGSRANQHSHAANQLADEHVVGIIDVAGHQSPAVLSNSAYRPFDEIAMGIEFS